MSMSDIVIREVNGKRFGVNPHRARQILFDADAIPDELADGNFDVKEIAAYLLGSRRHMPLVLKHEITSMCELSCSFCYIKGHVGARHTSFNEARCLYEHLLSKGLFYAILTGGNPLLNPDFNKIYRYLKRSGVFVDVYTNGLSFDDETFELFDDYPPRTVEITFYASADERSEPYRVAERLAGMGIHVLAKVTLSTDTADVLPEVATWASAHGIRLSIDSDLFDARDGRSVSRLLVRHYELSQKQDVCRDGKVPAAFSCSAGYCSAYVDSDGRLGFCPRSTMRFDGPFSRAYEELKSYVGVHRGRLFSSKCTDCPSAQSCRMCIARADLDDAGRYCVPSGWCPQVC